MFIFCFIYWFFRLNPLYFYCTVTTLDSSLGGYKLTTKDGKIAYYHESEGADSARPFKSTLNYLAISNFCTATDILEAGTYEYHAWVQGYDSNINRFNVINKDTGDTLVSVGNNWGTGIGTFDGTFVLTENTTIELSPLLKKTYVCSGYVKKKQ